MTDATTACYCESQKGLPAATARCWCDWLSTGGTSRCCHQPLSKMCILITETLGLSFSIGILWGLSYHWLSYLLVCKHVSKRLYYLYCTLGSHCQHLRCHECPSTAANRPFTWKPLLGMQTVTAPPGGLTEYWQKHQHATWLKVLQENQNTDSSTTLYCSTPDSITLCTAVLTEVTGPTYCICKMATLTFQTKTNIQRLSVVAVSQTTPPNTQGRDFRFQPNLLWSVSTSAVLLLKRYTEILVPLSS